MKTTNLKPEDFKAVETPADNCTGCFFDEQEELFACEHFPIGKIEGAQGKNHCDGVVFNLKNEKLWDAEPEK